MRDRKIKIARTPDELPSGARPGKAAPLRPRGEIDAPARSGILSLIGNTPLVEIKKLHTDRRVRLFAKLEYRNPGGSIKDRIALSMIERAEQRGDLGPGRIVLEATSGNTGIGLALVCAVKGYRLLLTMSESVSLERRKILRALGAEILLTPAERSTDGAIEKAYQMAREEPDTYFVPDQFNNPDNWLAHYHGTAEEIWRDTQGKVTHLLATIGTTGTVMGVSRRLKELNPDIQIVGVEPMPGHKIQGLKNLTESYVPEIFDKKRLDKKLNVEDGEAFEMARRLAREEGILAGMSSGAAIAAALRYIRGIKEGVVVVILPDGGERYLSTSLFVPREIPTFCFYNTSKRRKENFEPLEPGKVQIYCCGPTVDRRVDLSVCRRVVVADLVRRYLQYKGFQTHAVMNITDLDDRTIQGAERHGLDLKTFTEQHTQTFHEDLGILGVLKADHYPRASEHVDSMIKMAQRLQEKGYAYVQHGSLYFDISKFQQYGRLSRVDLRKIRVGSTVDLDNYQKDNPRDFTLFKRSTLSELKRGIYFTTPWGNARPGWHIECGAMATHYLGETLDVHMSSSDHVFPHHDNEIAICEAATGKPFVRYWLHNEQILMHGRKMSMEQGNYVTLQDLLDKGFTGREIRFFLLRTHYRKPLYYSPPALCSARSSLQRLDHFTHRLQFAVEEAEGEPEVVDWTTEAREAFEAALDDDLNVAVALAAVFGLLKRVNPILDEGKLGGSCAQCVKDFLKDVNAVFNVMALEESLDLDDHLMKLIQEREQMRRQGDWKEADRIREELDERGIRLIDTARGTHWIRMLSSQRKQPSKKPSP
jgi:cysteinyl-tRNA synthetase